MLGSERVGGCIECRMGKAHVDQVPAHHGVAKGGRQDVCGESLVRREPMRNAATAEGACQDGNVGVRDTRLEGGGEDDRETTGSRFGGKSCGDLHTPQQGGLEYKGSTARRTEPSPRYQMAKILCSAPGKCADILSIGFRKKATLCSWQGGQMCANHLS